MRPIFSYGCASVVGIALLLATTPAAQATVSVSVSDSYGSLGITPTSGTVEYLGGLETSAYGQAGADGQYDSGSFSSAYASDAPAAGATVTGGAAAGSASATGFIPAPVTGFDTSTGQASTYGLFEITGVTGPVTVTFSNTISGALDLSANNYGVKGRGEAIYTLCIDGAVVLGYDNPITIGPGGENYTPIDSDLSDSISLMGDTPYYLFEQADAEALVVNSSAPAPDSMQGPAMAVALAISVMFLLALRHRKGWVALVLLGAGFTMTAHATYIGGDRPNICKTCGAKANQLNGGTGTSSLSQGNNQMSYPIDNVTSGYGQTLSMGLTYNSENADGSKAQLDTGLGFGWTHSYNSMLFQQRGQMFRLGSDGQVTQYFMNYSSPSNYASDTGYFETLAQHSDGTFWITNKYQSWWQYGLVPNSPFLIEGPVYQLLQMGDRNNNTTTLTYNGSGMISTVMDPFGRTLQFTYNSSNKLSSVTDPLGRMTRFQYDSQYRELTQITDPAGKTVQYTYNAQDQITLKMDRDGRMYFYTYKYELPFMVADGSGQTYFSMTNPTNWSVNATDLAFSMERSYNPSTTSVTDGNGRVWQYAYDTNGYITQTIAPDGATSLWTYDPGTLGVASMTDANGNTTHWTYDPEGNRISTTDALGDTTTWIYDPVFNEATSMTDPLGRITDWTYDGNGNMLSMTDPLGQTERWTYDSHGDVLTHTDKNGNTTTNTYDSFGERISITDPLGNTTRWTYDANGNVLSMSDPLGRVTDWTYDNLDRQIGMTNALDGITQWTYDPLGNLLTTTDPIGNTTTWQYDDRSRMIEAIDPLGDTTRWTYDPDENRITSTTPNGNVTTNAYDVQNRKIETIDPLGGTMHWTYDPQGNRLSSTDQNGNTTHWTYDPLNRVIGMTNAIGGVTSYDYSMVGSPACCSATPGTSLLMELKDPDGNITFYHYDELNRRVQALRKNSDTNNVINPTDAVTTWSYDPDNNVIAVTDPNGNTTTWTYDADNRKISMVDAAGDTTRWNYDPVGNVLAATAPNLNTTTNGYDGLNRLISQHDEIGLIRSNSYDADGNKLSATDGLGHTTSWTYDALNRQTTMTDALGHPTTMTYDPDNNVISTTARNGRATTFTYDRLDRRASMTDALGNTTLTTYDPDSNIIGMTDANGHTTSYGYDALNRVISETYPDTPPNSRTFIYDPVGNLIQRVDQKGQVTTYSYNDLYYRTNRAYSPSGSIDSFTYDDGGRMLSANRNGWADTFAYDGANRLTSTVQDGRTVTYTYNIPGRTQTNTQPSGRVLNYLYDARNHLAALNDTTSNPSLAAYAYDDANRVVTRSYRNGATATYTYNPNDWLISLSHSNATSLIAGFNYAYDNEGNKLYEQKLDNPTNSSAYIYDAINRLTSYDAGTLSVSNIPTPALAETWALDSVGNWNNFTSNSVPDVRTYGPANELLTDNGSNYLYDANGNIIQDNSYNYSYDEENRLIQLQRRSDSVIVGQYSYDALSRRVAQISNPAGSSETNLYFYDRRRLIEEQNPGGSTLATYTYGNYVDEVLTMNRGGQTNYYHQNDIWSPYALTDSTGSVTERYAYDAYGRVAVLDPNYNALPLNSWGTPHSPLTNCWLFTGRQFDEESGVYFYRARYYDSEKGRFCQRDPLDYFDSINLYEYAHGAPADGTDPYGLAEMPKSGKVGFGVECTCAFTCYNGCAKQENYRDWSEGTGESDEGDLIDIDWSDLISIGPKGVGVNENSLEGLRLVKQIFELAAAGLMNDEKKKQDYWDKLTYKACERAADNTFVPKYGFRAWNLCHAAAVALAETNKDKFKGINPEKQSKAFNNLAGSYERTFAADIIAQGSCSAKIKWRIVK